MTSTLNIQIARAVGDERIAAAGRARAGRAVRRDRSARATVDSLRSSAPGRPDGIMALRLAASDERAAVDRLADLDGVKPLRGDVLLAVLDGEPVAALSLADGRVAADPFRRTRDAVELLRMRAQRLAAPADGSRHGRRRRLLARLAG